MGAITQSFILAHGGSIRPLASILALSLLTACASGPGAYKPVGDPIIKQSRVGDCGYTTQTSQRVVNPSDEEKLVELSKIVDFDETCGDFNILAIVARAEQDTPDGALASAAVLIGLSGKNPHIREYLTEALQRNNITEQTLHERVARDFIRTQMTALRRDDGKPNYAAIAVLLDLRTQGDLPQERRRYPALPPVFIREITDEELEKKGLDAEILQQVYNAGFGQDLHCETITHSNGTSQTRCTQQKVAPGLFIF